MVFETTIYDILVQMTGTPHNDLEQFTLFFFAIVLSIVLILMLFSVMMVIAKMIKQ